jgi:hypothetical protein
MKKGACRENDSFFFTKNMKMTVFYCEMVFI